MDKLQIFKNKEFGEIRVLEIDGEPWLVGRDVATILGYAKPQNAIATHVDKDDTLKQGITDSIGRTQETTLINESGFYSLVLSSKLSTAKKFKKWVTSEVLPSIRKHGAYLTDEKIEEVLTNPDTIIKLAMQLKEERQKRLQAEHFTNQIAVSQNSLLVREVAKIASKKGIKIGEKRLYEKLRKWGLIFKNSTEPKQEYINRGYFEVVEGVRENSKGTFTYRTTRVTGKGQVYIIKRLLEEQVKGE